MAVLASRTYPPPGLGALGVRVAVHLSAAAAAAGGGFARTACAALRPGPARLPDLPASRTRGARCACARVREVRSEWRSEWGAVRGAVSGAQ